VESYLRRMPGWLLTGIGVVLAFWLVFLGWSRGGTGGNNQTMRRKLSPQNRLLRCRSLPFRSLSPACKLPWRKSGARSILHQRNGR